MMEDFTWGLIEDTKVRFQQFKSATKEGNARRQIKVRNVNETICAAIKCTPRFNSEKKSGVLAAGNAYWAEVGSYVTYSNDANRPDLARLDPY